MTLFWFWTGFAIGILLGMFLMWVAICVYDELRKDTDYGGE